MILDDILYLYKNKKDHVDFLLKYSKIADNLLFHDISFIKELVDYLINATKLFVNNNPIYLLHDQVDKSHLMDKCLWYDQTVNYFTNKTGGSTGKKFEYRIWKDTYKNIEGESHYGAICKEFNIKSNVKILYIQQDVFRPHSDKLVEIISSTNPYVSFGLYHQAEIHRIIVNRTYLNNQYKYYENIINYANRNQFDIIHTKSNVISSLAWNIKRLNNKSKLGTLLSNTGSKVDPNDLNYLLAANTIDNWCDHMRCWDGGATFYTCKHQTYHLMDGLSYCYSKNNRLRSIDFFSLPSPFVNYWNGDYAQISNDYQRCACGRAYRSFNMGRTRSETTSIVSDSQIIIDKLKHNGLLDQIKRIDVIDPHLRIITYSLLPNIQKLAIKSMFNSAQVDFYVEEPL